MSLHPSLLHSTSSSLPVLIHFSLVYFPLPISPYSFFIPLLHFFTSYHYFSFTEMIVYSFIHDTLIIHYSYIHSQFFITSPYFFSLAQSSNFLPYIIILSSICHAFFILSSVVLSLSIHSSFSHICCFPCSPCFFPSSWPVPQEIVGHFARGPRRSLPSPLPLTLTWLRRRCVLPSLSFIPFRALQ